MQFLNNLVKDDNYTVPSIQRIIESTQGKKFFTVIDLKDGYYQIRLKKEDRHKTAFYFNNKLYQWKVMPQGFKRGPPIFQRTMDIILYNQVPEKCNVYLDDIIVYGKTEAEYDENLNIVLKTLEKNNFKINAEKIQYKQKKVKFLGSIIDGEKQEKIIDFKRPETVKELQSFLGFANYYNQYIKDFAEITAPLYEKLRKKEKNLVIWNNECENAFNELKLRINTDIAVHIPNFDIPFVLTTDASNHGIGAVLQQDVEGELEVIKWASKKLTDAEKKMGIIEKEFLGMSWGIEHFESN